MANTGVTFDLGELEKNMIRLANETNVFKKAQLKAGQYLAEKLENKTPEFVYADIDAKSSIKLKDNVRYQVIKEDSELRVGYGKETYWRAHFANIGTDTQQGSHFIEQTIAEEGQNTMNIIIQETKKGLKL